MKSIVNLSCAVALLSGTALARWFSRSNGLVRRGDKGCGFTISSPEFAHPAGELPDGQIRLNGTEGTATFYINADGGITDSNGFGCSVTAPPTTQVQCDQGTAPAPDFSIDLSGNLLYKRSPDFFACPATDTEYNVYVNPDFGQNKCFAITLQASGCGASATSCAPPSTLTVWQTQTVTENATQTITITTTSVQDCTTSTPFTIVPPPINLTTVSTTSTPPTIVPPPISLTTVCHRCTKSYTSTKTPTWTTVEWS